MTRLMTAAEMQRRWQNNEDPFDLTIEKWNRIRQFIDSASSVSDFNKLLQAANVAVPFCFQYQIRGCVGCPLEQICGQGRGVKLLKVMKLIQFYSLAILAGNMPLKESLFSEIDGLITELKTIKAQSSGESF
ncbi:MAG: hypothetical protein ACOC6B_04890 [Thermodesulfobacteriota bacterium]